MTNKGALKGVALCLVLLGVALWGRHESNKKTEAALQKEFNAVILAVCGDPPAARKTEKEIRQELEIEMAELTASIQSPAAMERWKVHKAAREARAERLQSEWGICVKMAWDQHQQDKHDRKAKLN